MRLVIPEPLQAQIGETAWTPFWSSCEKPLMLTPTFAFVAMLDVIDQEPLWHSTSWFARKQHFMISRPSYDRSAQLWTSEASKCFWKTWHRSLLIGIEWPSHIVHRFSNYCFSKKNYLQNSNHDKTKKQSHSGQRSQLWVNRNVRGTAVVLWDSHICCYDCHSAFTLPIDDMSNGGRIAQKVRFSNWPHLPRVAHCNWASSPAAKV